MKQKVLLRILGKQTYEGQEPDTIELVTSGELEFADGGWNITYEESELTGLKGVYTTFRVEREKLILTRTGGMATQMVFERNVPHDSLYQMDFGALKLTVCAISMIYDITSDGGFVDLSYSINIEDTQAGVIDYHLDIRAQQ